MKRAASACCLALVFILLEQMLIAGQLRHSPQTSSAIAVDSERLVFDRYCITCHNEKLRAGGLTLAGIDPADVSTDAATWEKVVRKLRTRSMPPPGLPRPDNSVYETVAG